MFIIAFFTTVIVFSLGLNAYYKLKDYNKDDKTVWQDGDSVRIVRNSDKNQDPQINGFMKRIA